MAAGHQVELSDEVYAIAERESARAGVTPEEWVAAAVRRARSNGDLEPPDREAAAKVIGSIDSANFNPDPRYRTEYSDYLVEKFRKQGIVIP